MAARKNAIVASYATKLATIQAGQPSPVAGVNFENTIESVQRYRQRGQTYESIPMIVLASGDDRLDEEETEYLDRALDLHVEVWTSQKEGAAVETDELLASLERDVLLVMLNNRQTVAGVLDLELVGSFPFEEERTMPMCGLVIMFRLRYRISNVNPDTGP